MKSAWAFYRRSTDRQELSIDDQRRACVARAAQLGFTIAREFVPPKGFASGLTIEQDPAFQDMVRQAERGAGVERLFIYDVSRLGRLAPKRKFYWEEHLRRHGVEIVYAAEPFQNDGSLGDEIHQFVSHSEAHQYSVRLRTSTLRGAKSHAALGRSCGGAAPYGYARKLVDGAGREVKTLRPGEHKADKLQHVVWSIGPAHEVRELRRIFKSYARGMGLRAIAEDLNRRQVPAPRAAAWLKTTVRAILRNPAYLGTRVYFKHNYHDRTGGPAKRVRPASEWTVTENAHPALISPELFEKVSARFRTHNPRAGRAASSPHLLAGMVSCARCGHRYYAQRKRDGVYYICGGYHLKGPTFCSSNAVAAKTLEAFALAQFERQVLALRDAGTVRARFAELERAAAAPATGESEEGLRAEIGQVDAELNRMLAALRVGGALEVLVAEMARLETRKKDLQQQLAAARFSPLAAEPEAVAAELAELVGDVPALLAEGTVAEQRVILREFLEAVTVDPVKQEARFAFHTIPPALLKQEGPGALGAGAFHRDHCGGPIWPLLISVLALGKNSTSAAGANA